MNEKVVVGLSGGVDSAVSAYLLKQQGYEVIGVTLKTYGMQDSSIQDAKAVADRLGIPHYTFDCEDTFKKEVIDYFIQEYERGYTPNPCNMCNRKIKWEYLLKCADQLGAKYIATGHYAKIIKLPNGRYSIQNSITAAKDQTYALHKLTQEQLSHTLMPVGNYEKSEIRKIAESIGLPVASKHDSQDICFIPDHDYVSFIEKMTGHKYKPGNFINEEGKVLGRHNGVIRYTIGQRRGLGLTSQEPVFVKELRVKSNEVVISNKNGLYSDTCYISDINYMARDSIKDGEATVGKIRYSHKPAACRLYPLQNGIIKVVFDEPVRSITPGQAAVFYDGDCILCSGTIENTKNLLISEG